MVTATTTAAAWDAERAFEQRIGDYHELFVVLLAAADMPRAEARRWCKLFQAVGAKARDAYPHIGWLRETGWTPDTVNAGTLAADHAKFTGLDTVYEGRRRCTSAPCRLWLSLLSMLGAIDARRLSGLVGLGALLLVMLAGCRDEDGAFSTDLPEGRVTVNTAWNDSTRKVCVVAGKGATGFTAGREYCRGLIPNAEVAECLPAQGDRAASHWPACRTP